MDAERVFTAHIVAHLAHGFQVRKSFDVACGSADFHNHDVVMAASTQIQHFRLDLVGDVRHHLHGFPQVRAFALFGNHVVIDASGGDVVFLGSRQVQETLVVAQIEIGFGTVVGHIHFPVFVGVHGAGIHIDVGIQFLYGDVESACDQKTAQRGANDPFAQGGGDSSGDKHVFGRHAEWLRWMDA